MGYKDIQVKIDEPKEPDTLKWLLTTCAPSLARLIAIHGTQFKDEFEEVVRQELLKFHKNIRVDEDQFNHGRVDKK